MDVIGRGVRPKREAEKKKGVSGKIARKFYPIRENVVMFKAKSMSTVIHICVGLQSASSFNHSAGLSAPCYCKVILFL